MRTKIDKLKTIKKVFVETPIIRPVVWDRSQMVRFNKEALRFEFAWDTAGTDGDPEWKQMDWDCWIGPSTGSAKEIRESLVDLLGLLDATCPPKKKRSR